MGGLIGQAIYGELARGHQLLSASPAFPEPEGLAGRMDLQGSPPPHTPWEPYLSGFRWNDSYVIACTMPDSRSSRAGMVFSRALAIPLADAGGMSDIGGLLDLLEALGDDREAAKDLEVPAHVGEPSANAGLVAALLAEGPDPAVWPGQGGFAAALRGLWASLWPSARLALRFRVAFSPADVALDPPTIVTTPAELVSRWTGHRIAKPNAPVEDGDAATRFLSGDRGGTLGQLVAALSGPLSAIRDIHKLVDMDSFMAGEGGLAEHIDGLRLACHLASEPGLGGAVKEALVGRAVEALRTADPADVRMARNLDLSAAAGQGEFWAALSDWAAERMWEAKDAVAIGRILDDAFSNRPTPDWRDAVTKGALEATGRPTATIAKRLWSILPGDPDVLARLSEGRFRTQRLEKALVAAAPTQLEGPSAATLAAAALGCGMALLHAACCAAGMEPSAAIARHLADAPATAESVAIAARRASGRQLVEAAVSQDSEALALLAAAAAAARPTLLAKLDVADARWRQLWKAAIELDPRAAEGPSDPANAMARLIDGLTNGTVNDPQLLTVLAATPLADLSDHRRASDAWFRLPPSALPAYLDASANGWLAKVESGGDPAIDATLAGAITKPERLDPVLRRLAASPRAGCRLFGRLPQLDQARFRTWLREVLRVNAQVAVPDAQALGRVVASRDWDLASYDLADAIADNGREDLRPAVEFIVDMIGMIRRYQLDESWSSSPSSARWQVLEEVLVQLYGTGTSDHHIWTRAGGREGDMPKSETGADAWRKVIADLQKGKAVITAAGLIGVMLEDYRDHPVLGKMRRDPLFEARR